MGEDQFPRFAAVPAGQFMMGSHDGEEDERPPRPVRVDAFHVSSHAITVEQYAAFVRDSGHPAPALKEMPRLVTPERELQFRELASGHVWRGGEPPHDRLRHPITLVTHADATAYCRWLSGRIGQLVRLPTEAEWERAARGDLEARRFPWGDEIDHSCGNFLAEGTQRRRTGTRPVGSYPPNGFQLYDMAGNVWQWIADWYRSDQYSIGENDNPRGPAQGLLRVVRGGSWVTSDIRQLRCAHRHKVPVDTYTYSIGFRVVYSGGTVEMR